MIATHFTRVESAVALARILQPTSR